MVKITYLRRGAGSIVKGLYVKEISYCASKIFMGDGQSYVFAIRLECLRKEI